MRIVFHHPHPIRDDATAASGIRPFRMAEAFRQLGCQVDLVCGHSAERAQRAREVASQLEAGTRYAFMYAESSTEPTLLTDPHHLPLRPRFDFALFARLKRAGVPLGLFYRDIYWRFPDYGAALPSWKRVAARAMYRYDLWQYRRTLDRLYLPSLAMAPFVPWVPRERMAALPPGYADRPLRTTSAPALRLFYVGGIGPHYEMHELFAAVHEVPQVQLTVCTRPDEWAQAAPGYAGWLCERVRIVHASGADLDEHLAQCDIGVLCVRPRPYWEFAAPVKLYEYLGAGKPILASEGTHAAGTVTGLSVGWAVAYASGAIAERLRSLVADRSAVRDKAAVVERVRGDHEWKARARQVVEDLAAR